MEHRATQHLLLHLAKYIRLWGPLWTHSAFGFDNKNGQLKYLFHGKSDIVHQILFNVDRRLNMTQIGHKMYIVGQSNLTVPNAEQRCALDISLDDLTVRIQVFSRLLLDGIMYLSTSYPRASRNKRDDTICCYYEASSDSICCGQIELFTATPGRSALVRKLQPLEETLLAKGGHSCREELAIYQQVDLLSACIIPVALPSSSSPLISISKLEVS